MRYAITDLLPAADKANVCIPAFDIADGQREFLLGVLDACQKARCPALLLAWSGPHTLPVLEATIDFVNYHAERATVPVVLHLDHGPDEVVVAKALELGMRSVMYDGSALPLEENIRRTKALTELAHSHGAFLEGEIGRIGAELADGLGAHALTDPQEAAEFVRATGIDMLAPAVGNVHGFYKATPKLHFDLIAKIRQAVSVPLSLHGGTGIPCSDVCQAAKMGFRKINVATALHHAFSLSLRAASEPGMVGTEKPRGWQQVLAGGRAAVAAAAMEYIDGLGVGGLVP